MAKSESNVDRIYEKLRQMAGDFEFKPDARINESRLSLELGASRTPLREALNRLVAEEYLTFQSGRGFFCRPLSPEGIVDLYEARIEAEAVRRACLRAIEADLIELGAYLDETEPEYSRCQDLIRLLAIDEGFHMRICELSKNQELLRLLRNLNGRIRYVRLVGLRLLRDQPPAAEKDASDLSAHRIIFNALKNRDSEHSEQLMRQHIERRREEATQAVQMAFAQLYVPSA